jgi:hypothetical protein
MSAYSSGFHCLVINPELFLHLFLYRERDLQTILSAYSLFISRGLQYTANSDLAAPEFLLPLQLSPVCSVHCMLVSHSALQYLMANLVKGGHIPERNFV